MADELTRAKLIPVTGTNDTPDMENAISVQFNPTSLKVGLSNTLKAGKRGSSSKAAQFVDKSSSNLTVELIFDTTLEDTDVRVQTKKIAEKFMKPIEAGNKLKAPTRCRFQWGAFAFVGMVQSFDETVDFFSPQGTPLRATVSLKLTEDKFQFITEAAAKTAKTTPTLTSTGNQDGGNTGGKNVGDANKQAGMPEKDWRDTALYNGIESPRFPDVSALSVPKMSIDASISASVGLSTSMGASAGTTGFSYGASASLGTKIDGAFSSQVTGSNVTGTTLDISKGKLLATAGASGKIRVGTS